MSFWDFVAKEPIAVIVFLWFLWCVYDRFMTHIERLAERQAGRPPPQFPRREPTPLWKTTEKKTTTETKETP